MNAERLLQFASDFVDDYNVLKILSLLDETQQICGGRPPANNPTFASTSESLRMRADLVVKQTRFNTYPQAYMNLISATPYIKFLPARMAQVVTLGLTGDVATTMSAGEVTAISNSAKAAYTELLALKQTLSKFGVTPIALGGEEISVEFNLPRSSFKNEAAQYLKWNERVERIVAAYNEFTGEDVNRPGLVFTSTTDPVVGYIAYIHSAYAITQLINGLLQVAKNAIELYGAFKTLRKSGASSVTETMDTHIRSVTETAVRTAVEGSLLTIKSPLDEGRANEIKNRITIHATLLIPVVIEGATISISPESLKKISGAELQLMGSDNPTFLNLIAETRGKELDVREAFRLSGGENVMRITLDEPASTDEIPEA